ncbi:arginine N-succinyltransferase, partial [Klebsiella pneumoniae]|uniref:arginine N-succinyltransferase n=1 Tax=Klebsiella pneumoniae TaxID=573 RepID=UPI0025A2B653
VDEATLAARIARSQQTWRGELPKSEQGYVFVLEESESGAVVGIEEIYALVDDLIASHGDWLPAWLHR